MTLINNAAQAAGNIIGLKQTNPKHFAGSGENVNRSSGTGSFRELVSDAMGQVQQKQDTVNGLMEQMLINPDSVAVHDVTTAMAQAELSLRTTKAVIDRAVRAYTDIVNMR